jgi:AbrB family looped-hinge helix DNA binding protein
LVTFKYFLLFFVVLVFALVEVFVARVCSGGKVTIPKRVRELLGVGDGDYVRLSVVEVVKRGKIER